MIMSKPLTPWKLMIAYVRIKGICKNCKWFRFGQGGLVVVIECGMSNTFQFWARNGYACCWLHTFKMDLEMFRL
jgi:hypothetical protein